MHLPADLGAAAKRKCDSAALRTAVLPIAPLRFLPHVGYDRKPIWLLAPALMRRVQARKFFTNGGQAPQGQDMRRPVILGGNPYIQDYYQKDSKTLFDETGGNTGNLAFMYAVANHIAGARFLHWGASVEEIRAAGDIIVLPLANQLGSHTDLGSAAARLESINLPVVGIGLGAQTKTNSVDVRLTDGTAQWINTIARLSPSEKPNIGVRGEYTATQITKLGLHGKSVVTGCPSNFINCNDITKVISQGFQRQPKCIAVAAGIPFIPELASIERNLADIVTLSGGAYIVQHGLQMIQLTRNEFGIMAGDSLSVCHKYISPHISEDEFRIWCRRYAFAFYDVRAWMDFLRRFDFVVGTRFHGVMLAIQAGVPAGCIAHDSRTQEMCDTMGIPVRRYTDINEPLTQYNLLDYFQFDAERYRSLRSALHLSYCNLLKDADIMATNNLKKVR